jgi:DNA polymerase-3 subunit beta
MLTEKDLRMLLTIKRQALIEVVDLVASVAPLRASKPVLQCVLLDAQGSLVASASDLEVYISMRAVGAKVERQGKAAVNADKLRGILHACDAEQVTLDADGEWLKLRVGKDTFRLHVTDPKDFPQEPAIAADDGFDATTFVVEAPTFRKLVDLTKFCVKDNSEKFVMGGALFVFGAGKFNVVGTDGRRVALAWASFPAGKKETTSAIVPKKALALMSRIDAPEKRTVSVLMNKTHVAFLTENDKSSRVLVVASQLEGIFPPYSQVIPVDVTSTFSAESATLLAAVRRAKLMTSEESKACRFKFSKDGLQIESQSANEGDADVRSEGSFIGFTFDIGFNPSFLEDVLKVCGDKVELKMNGYARPALITSEGLDAQYVILPTNLNPEPAAIEKVPEQATKKKPVAKAS